MEKPIIIIIITFSVMRRSQPNRFKKVRVERTTVARQYIMITVMMMFFMVIIEITLMQAKTIRMQIIMEKRISLSVTIILHCLPAECLTEYMHTGPTSLITSV